VNIKFAKIRPDLIEEELAVPVGEYYVFTTDKLPYRWLNDDEIFQIYYLVKS